MQITEGELSWPLLPPGKPGTSPSDEQWGQAQTCAVEWLWSVSGRRYGTRVATLRPGGEFYNPQHWASVAPYIADVYGALWGMPRQCGEQLDARVIQLPGPAQSVEAVTLVDGDGASTLLDASAYRLDGDYLVRVDGAMWPRTQDSVADMGSPNTWDVVYERGHPVPVPGQVAAAQLAAEWVKMITGDKSACKIPWNATSAARSGVTVQLQASLAYRTSGISAVDRWVTSVNPNGMIEPPRVWTPDIARNASPYQGARAPYQPTAIGSR